MNDELPNEVCRQAGLSQGEVFLRGEGDRWFERNRINLTSSASLDTEMTFLIETLKPFSESINSILEVGCADGVKLRKLCKELNATGCGIDPSAKAIGLGQSNHIDNVISLSVGLAHNLPYDSSSFDLVHFGFCLYLIDRENIKAALNEAHRVLKPGGFMVITDFDPAISHARPYHHYNGLFSYKTDYAAALVSPGFYHLAYKHSYSHHQPFFDRNSDERVAVSILYKEITNVGDTPINLR